MKTKWIGTLGAGLAALVIGACSTSGTTPTEPTGTIDAENAQAIGQPLSGSAESGQAIFDSFKEISSGMDFQGGSADIGMGRLLGAGRGHRLGNHQIHHNEVGTTTEHCNGGGTFTKSITQVNSDGEILSGSMTFNDCVQNNTKLDGSVTASSTESDSEFTGTVIVEDFQAENSSDHAKLTINKLTLTGTMSDNTEERAFVFTAKGNGLKAIHGAHEASLTSVDLAISADTASGESNITVKNTVGYIQNPDMKNAFNIVDVSFAKTAHASSLDVEAAFKSTPSCFDGWLGIKTFRTITVSDGNITDGKITFRGESGSLTIEHNSNGTFTASGAVDQTFADQKEMMDYFDANGSSCQAQ